MLSTTLERLLTRTDIDALPARLMSRASLTEADQNALDRVAAELGERLEDCRLERRTLATLELAIAQRLAFACNLSSPIHRLSDDELRLIFLAVATTFRNPFHRAPYFAKTISTVSRRWRAIARSTASLWNHLVLRPSRVVFSRGLPQRTTPWNHFAYVASLCSRAPIHVRWNLDVHPVPLLEFASAIPNVIHSLDLTADWSSLPIMTSRAFDHLQRLSLTISGAQNQFLMHNLDSLARLVSLHIYCQNGDPFPSSFTTASLPGLRDLRARLLPGPPLPFIVETLTNCSQLTSLDLRFDFPLGVPPKDTPPLCLPALATIYLADAACAIVWFLRSPSATTLYLSEVHDIWVHGSVFGAIQALVQSSACNLETLGFSYAYSVAQVDEVRRCLSALTTVTDLLIEYSWDEPYPASFGKVVVDCLCDETLALLPRLRSIFFRATPRRGRYGVEDAIDALRQSRSTARRVGARDVEIVDDFYSNVVEEH